MKPYQIDAQKCLIIPDSHQDIKWIQAILERERGNYDHIITLGDEFDSYKSYPEVASTKEMARFVIDLQNGSRGPVTQLLGNHNLAYAESWASNSRFSHKKHLFNSCSGFTNSKAIDINKIFKWENWQKYQLFAEFSGYLISHAGFHHSFWNFYKTKEENLDGLWEEAREAIQSISIKPSRLFGCGQVRGGQQKVGGPCWLDESEYEDHEEMPKQLFGHTRSDFVREKGKGVCIDCGQTVYAVLGSDGEIEIKKI